MTPPVIPGWICEEAIGHGADATVWRARPAAGGGALALKVIPLARLRDPAAHLREAWAAGSTGCRQVVAVHDAGQHGDCAWLAMELAHEDAAMLAARCGGRLRPATAARIARDVARGLQALADHGFVHRDVKPSNILLRADGSAMIGDLAPLRGGGTATRSADLSGTPAYLSPEQIRGSAPDVRSDVHALGATIFALIAGRPPFTADGALDLLRAIAETPAPTLVSLVPDIPPAIADVVTTALAKDPVRRQQRPIQLANELDEALAGRTPSRAAAPAVRVAATPAEPHAWPTWLPAAAAACVAALLGLGVGTLAARPSAQALADEAQAAETAALALCERRHSEREEAVIATLRQRLDRLRLERDRMQAAHPRQPAAGTARPETAPAKPQPSQPVAAPAPPTAPTLPAIPAVPPPPAPDPDPPAHVQVQAPTPPAASDAPVAPPVAQESALADWAIPWELAWAEPEPPPSALAFNVLPNPEPTASGISWSRWEPGVLLTWDIDSVRVSTNGGVAWSQAWSGPQPEGSYASPGRTATWGGCSVLLPTGINSCGLLSNDGGRSFKPLPGASGADDSAPDRSGRRTLLADGALAMLAETPKRTVINLSQDGGRTWRLAASCDTAISMLVPLAQGFGLLRGSGSTLSYAATVDSGWSRLGRSSAYSVATFHYGGAMHLLTGDGTLARISARDGMRTVHLARLPAREPVGFAIDPRDARHVLVADASLGLLRTCDGGLTWQSSARRLANRIVAMDLVGRRRPRLAVMTSRSLALIDLDNRLGEHFRPLPAASEALRRIELPGLQGNIPVGLGVRPADPRSVAAWSYSQAWTSQDGGGTWARSTFQSAATLDLAAVPTWDAKGVRVVVPLASDLAMVGDMAGGVLVPLAPPWGRTARGAYAIPASQRADGLIVAGWAPEGSSTGDGKALRVCSTRDLGRTWTEERKVGMRQWLVVDPDLPLLASSGYDGLIVSADFGRSERVLEAPGRPSFGPVWCLVGRQMWWIDRGWTRVSAYDLDSQRQRSQAIRAPGSGEEYFYYRNMAMDPRDPRRIWVSDNGFGLISSADGGLTWGMMDSGIGAATSSHIRYIDGERPYLLIGGLGCLWRIDAGPAGAALFDRPCSIIP